MDENRERTAYGITAQTPLNFKALKETMFRYLGKALEALRRRLTPPEKLLEEIEAGKRPHPKDVQAAVKDRAKAKETEIKRAAERAVKEAAEKAERERPVRPDELHESVRNHAASLEIRPINGFATEVIEIKDDKARVGTVGIGPINTVTPQRKKLAISEIKKASACLPPEDLEKIIRFLNAKKDDPAHTEVAADLSKAIEYILAFKKIEERKRKK